MLGRGVVIDAIRGAFIADAASLGTHWYYDVAELAKALPNIAKPEFKNPPAPKFYSSKEFPGHYNAGMLSPYGEQLLFVTNYCASKKGIDGDDISVAMLKWATSFGGRPDHALTTFIENMSKMDGSGKWPNCGADDNQASCILEAVLLGSSIGQALEKCKQEATDKVKDAFRVAEDAAANGQSLTDLLGEVGRHCGLPPSFIGPVYQLKMAADSPSKDSYVKAIRENVLAGGDTCSRAVFVGAVIAAANAVPPDSWVEQVDKEVLGKVDTLANTIADTAVGSSELKRNSGPSNSILLVCTAAALSFLFIQMMVFRRGSRRCAHVAEGKPSKFAR